MKFYTTTFRPTKSILIGLALLPVLIPLMVVEILRDIRDEKEVP